MYFADMARELAPAKLEFACSATLLDHVHALNLTPDQIDFLAGIRDAQYRESVLDFIVNRRFRRDYWVKGLRRLSPAEQIESLRKLRVVLHTPVQRVKLSVTGGIGQATLNERIYQPLLAALADHAPRSIGELEAALGPDGIDLRQLVQAVVVLAHANDLYPAQDDAAASAARKSTDRLNAHLIQHARFGPAAGALASPVTGGGLPVKWEQQLFLLARSLGHHQPADWARQAADHGSRLGQPSFKDGSPPQRREDVLAELTALATDFAEHELPALEALHVVRP
jgi:hypothetical protein